MSMMPSMRRAVVLLMILPGLGGCGRASQFAPSSVSDPAPTPAPVVMAANSIFPQSGATGRETSVEILGGGFQPGVEVTFGTVAASNVVVVDSATIWAGTPVSVAGTVDVVVTNPGGQSSTLARAFTFVSASP